MTLQQLVEFRAVALRELCRARDVALGDLQDAHQIVVLERTFRLVQRGQSARPVVERALHQRCRDHGAGRERYRLFHHILQLPHIAGPGCGDQGLQRFGREARDLLAVARRHLLQKMQRERHDVLGTLGQCRNAQRDHVQTVIQVLAKQALGNALVQAAVRGGNDAQIHVDGLGRAHGPHLALLQHAQQFRLQRQRHVADFVQKQGSAACALQQTLVVVGGAGECAFAVSEQFRFEQRLRYRGAVYGDEGRGGARAGAMDRACEQFLAGAARAVDEDACVGLGHQPRAAEHILHRRAGGDDAAAPIIVRRARSSGGDARRQLQRLCDLLQQGLIVEGLGQKTEYAAFGRGHRFRYGAVRRKNDHRKRRRNIMDGFEQGHAVHAVHLQIGDHELGARRGQGGQGAFAAFHRLYRVARCVQTHGHQLEDVRVVVDQQDKGFAVVHRQPFICVGAGFPARVP